MKWKCSVFISIAIIFMATPSWASDVLSHAPIGVMAEHMHKKGEWMASYRYMYMDMPHNYTGTTRLAVDEVHHDYMIAPVKMSMEMHMLGLMYGVSDQLTAMLMVPRVENRMDHIRRADGRRFTTRSGGIGDIKFLGMFSAQELTGLPMHVNLGVSFPTGSINEKDDTPLGPSQDLPYPMQIGSGTYDFHPGLTFSKLYDRWSWGAQAVSVLRFGKNEHKYRLGNVYEMTSWVARKWNEQVSTSFRVKNSIWGNISGADPRINPVMVPTANPEIRSGERIDLSLGLNFLSHEGFFKDHRLAVEIGYPVYQSVEGPQLGLGMHGTIGWQKVF